MGVRLSVAWKRAIAAAAVILVLLAVLVALAPSVYEVQAKGKGPPLVPYEGTGLIYKVKVLDTFTIYADEESRPIPDKLSSAGLVAAATVALMTWLLLHAAGADARRRRFYGYATIGLAYLAADELLAFHETIGHNLQFLTDVPGVERPDDLIFLLYGLPLALFAWSFRDVLLEERMAVVLFALGALMFALAVAGDIVGIGIDEPAEVVASLFLMAGLIVLTAATLNRELGLGRTRDERVPPERAPAKRPAVVHGRTERPAH